MDNTIPDPRLSSAQVIDDFLNLLLDEGGTDSASPDVRGQMFADLKRRLNEKIFATMLSHLSDDQITKLRELSEGGAPGEEIEKFIDEHIPSSKEIFAGALMEFRNDYLGIE